MLKSYPKCHVKRFTQYKNTLGKIEAVKMLNAWHIHEHIMGDRATYREWVKVGKTLSCIPQCLLYHFPHLSTSARLTEN